MATLSSASSSSSSYSHSSTSSNTSFLSATRSSSSSSLSKKARPRPRNQNQNQRHPLQPAVLEADDLTLVSLEEGRGAGGVGTYGNTTNDTQTQTQAWPGPAPPLAHAGDDAYDDAAVQLPQMYVFKANESVMDSRGNTVVEGEGGELKKLVSRASVAGSRKPLPATPTKPLALPGRRPPPPSPKTAAAALVARPEELVAPDRAEYILVFHNHQHPSRRADVEACVPSEYVRKTKSTDKLAYYSAYRRRVVAALRMQGFSVRQRLSASEREVFVLISAPPYSLARHASRLGLRSKLARVAVDPRAGVAQALDAGHSVFTMARRHAFEPFTEAQRALLIVTAIGTPRRDGGAGVDIPKELSSGRMLHCFPAHDPEAVERLSRVWSRALFSAQPLDEVRAYFGDSVAIYFSFLGFYSTALLFPAVLGTSLFILGLVQSQNFDTFLTPVYSVVFLLWATVFLQLWRRKARTLGLRWDLAHFRAEERPRPEFRGQRVHGIYGSSGAFVPLRPGDMGLTRETLPTTLHEPSYKFRVRVAATTMVITVLVALALAVSVGALVVRIVVDQELTPARKEGDFPWSGLLVGVANGLIVAVLNKVFRGVSVVLTRFENHRTASSFQTLLVAKIMAFQFTNSYCSLFYLAYFKQSTTFFGVPRLRDSCNPNCLTELTVQIASLLIMSQLVNIATDIVLPALALKWSRARGAKAARDGSGLSYEERQALLEEHPGTIDEYTPLCLQWGYLTLFCAAFPPGAAIALLSNLIELRFDATKHLRLLKKPRGDAERCDDIPVVYRNLFDLFGYASILTNVALLALVSDRLSYYVPEAFLDTQAKRVWAAVALEHALILVKLLISIIIPDQAYEVKAEQARQEFLSRWLFQDDPDSSKKAKKSGGKRKPAEGKLDQDKISDVDDWVK
jgi:anoctamin-10